MSQLSQLYLQWLTTLAGVNLLCIIEAWLGELQFLFNIRWLTTKYLSLLSFVLVAAENGMFVESDSDDRQGTIYWNNATNEASVFQDFRS